MYGTRYHRNGDVTYWDVYTQSWERRPAHAIQDNILATMTDRERTRIARLAAKSAMTEEAE